MARLIDASKLDRELQELVREYNRNCESDKSEGAFQALFLLRLAPNTEPERPKGRWKYYHKRNIAVCTKCSFERKLDADFGKAITCPNCGADMRGESNGC